jgi:DNA polymerase-3 subunit delta
MKLGYRNIEGFVQNPDKAARVILVYGPDYGLMRERSLIIAKTVTPDLDDPFNVAVLNNDILKDDPARLIDEANAISMLGGQRLVRVEDADDKLTAILKDYLAAPNPDALILLEAGDLGPRSSLRGLCERAKNAAAVPCYVDDEAALGGIIRRYFQEMQRQIDSDALNWLSANISGDRLKVRSELEKIYTYKGHEQGAITLDDVIAICGQAGAQSLDDLIYAMAGNNPQKALKSYVTLMEEGTSEIALLRAMQNHFRRLHIVKARVTEGEMLDSAMKTLVPPIFFKQERGFKAQAQRWTLATLEAILQRLAELEAQSKQSNTPVETLCAQAVLSISMMR